MFPRTLICVCAAFGLMAGPARADDKALVAELDALKKRLAERDIHIAQLQKDLQSLRHQAAAEQAKARTLQERAEKLLAEIERLHRFVGDPGRTKEAVAAARALVAGSAEIASTLPPDVRGKVTHVGDSNLVEISIGTDAGLKDGHTLDVFRIVPENPKTSIYLGKLTILRTDSKAAVGRYAAAARDRKPRTGDEVALTVDANKR